MVQDEMIENTRLERALYRTLSGEEEGGACRDIPDAACDTQPRNFLTHAASLAMTKTGDGIADPKLTLTWLMGAVGAPPALVGLLVPVRESLALLPQLWTSGPISGLARRKWAWAAGSLAQGLAVAGMAVAAVTLSGAAAGGVILGCLAVFALARSVCSVSYKDVLGKTVAKSTRGTATGLAASVAAAGVIGFGVLLSVGWLPMSVTSIAIALGVAAGLWLFAAGLFSTLNEPVLGNEGGDESERWWRASVQILREDPQLMRFIAARGLLISTALAPPFLLALGGEEGETGFGHLGPYVLASSLAALVSSYVWGRLADRSSRKVLVLAGLIGAGVLLAAATMRGWLPGLAGLVGDQGGGAATRAWVLPGLLFLLMLAYEGVRLGRSTHLVDMADADRRVAYTAISNTAIGGLLLAGSGFGVMAQWLGYPVVLAGFALMSAGAAAVAWGLNEVQQGSG